MQERDTTGKQSHTSGKDDLIEAEPIIIQDHYEIDYRHSYAQDSPFFVGLSKGVLLGSRCIRCRYMYATPRSHCMECGHGTTWEPLPHNGHIHTFTVCHFGGESFLHETPFVLILVEFPQVNTLFLSRLKGMAPEKVEIGLPVRPRFSSTPKYQVTDVWFEPQDLQ